MNLERLYEAEALFFQQYPAGFADEELTAHLKKRHPMDRLIELANTQLKRSNFKHTAPVLDSVVKLVGRSSMVSMFEKPKFRDYVNGLSRDDRAHLAQAFRRLLHGNHERGFTDLVDMLSEAKLAKWSLLTICPLYLRPNEEVFVKPTTTKAVIKRFELDHLVYKPRPSWAFYADYREAIEKMKAAVHPSLSPNNAAFTGFLMMTTGANQQR